jgi:predicted RNA-binding protein (virulence factor B family)
MINIGKKNHLKILKQVDFGFYLDGGDEGGEILLPNRYIPKEAEVGDTIEVFLYFDSEDRIIATTEEPFAQVNECAFLKVTDIGKFGVFMDWGLTKDLFVPFKEQIKPMQVGQYYSVYVYMDNTGRIAASSKLSQFLKEQNEGCFIQGQEVTLHIISYNQLGYLAAIDNTHLGLIHKDEVFKSVTIGETLKGYIKSIREDGKLNLTLQPKGEALWDPLCEKIMNYIKEQGGSITLTDKSPPEDIYKLFQVSKVSYKKAIGRLYKEGQIILDKDKLSLL